MVVIPQIAIIYTTTPPKKKTAFEAGFTTLGGIDGDGLYCTYARLDRLHYSTPPPPKKKLLLRWGLQRSP